MSLSEMPQVKITYDTPNDMSDAILGATIEFLKKTGYKQNLRIYTFFYAAFLVSSISEFCEEGLLEKVLNSYDWSISAVFPQVREDKNLEKQITEMCRHFVTNLNADFDEINTCETVEAVIKIANKLNNEGDDSASKYMLSTDPNKSFLEISSTLKSNLYRITRQINNGIGIEYQGLITGYRYGLFQDSNDTSIKNSNTSVAKADTSSVFNTISEKLRNRKKFTVKKFFIVLAIIFGGLLIIDATRPAPDPEPVLQPVIEPLSGAILSGSEDLYGSQLTVKAPSSESCVVKVKTSTGITRLSFYVRAGDSVTIGVPDELMYVYFASGDVWYGQNELFGRSTSYSMDDKICDFSQYEFTYTLYPVTSGNFSQTPIDAEDF